MLGSSRTVWNCHWSRQGNNRGRPGSCDRQGDEGPEKERHCTGLCHRSEPGPEVIRGRRAREAANSSRCSCAERPLEACSSCPPAVSRPIIAAPVAQIAAALRASSEPAAFRPCDLRHVPSVGSSRLSSQSRRSYMRYFRPAQENRSTSCILLKADSSSAHTRSSGLNG